MFDASKLHEAEPLDARSILNDLPVSFLPSDLDFHSERFKLQLSSPSAADEVCQSENPAASNPYLEAVSERLRAFFFFILKRMDESTDRSIQLDADVLRIVLGSGKPPSQVDLASKHGLTKQAVSIRCRTLLRQLGLETSVFMRPEDEVNSMRVARILNPRSLNGLRKKKQPPPPPTKESF